jgi:predicted Zn-dependent peptidase
VTRLPNGLTVIALRRPGLPVVSVLLGFHAEPQPGDVAGQRRGALLARYHDLEVGPVERGLLQRFSYDRDSYRESLSLFSFSFSNALQLLSDEAGTMAVSRDADTERWVAKASAEEKTPGARARRSYSDALLESHVYGLAETAEAVRHVSLDQIHRWLDRVWRPANGALVVVGDVDPSAVARQAASALAGWRGDPSKPPDPPLAAVAPPPEKRKRLSVLFTPDPASSTAEVRFGCLLPPVRERRDLLPGQLLRGLLDADLRRHLRDEMGASYSQSVSRADLRGGTQILEGELDLDARGLPRAMELLRVWLAPDGAASVQPSMLERERWRMARQSVGYSTSTQLARALFDAWNMGWPPAVLDDLPRDLAAVTLGDVATALQACRASAVVSVVAASAPPLLR